MPTQIFDSPGALFACVGQEVAVSDWFAVDQQCIDQFAEVTQDRQWIHVDPERAGAGPFGATVAHGFLTLSLIPHFFEQALQVNGVRMALNYGLNRVRFPSAVPVGSRLRARIKLLTVAPGEDGAYQLTWDVVVERQGSDKPACVAETLARFYV
ncbi:MAG: MaoC family dehydratase [Burkholderiaceae bacterium]|jgi:acyl dehydratase|nr:MaoC family dehydratase [Burkholderiaceae bacterium]